MPNFNAAAVLRTLIDRSGLKMGPVATAADYAGPSSIQRYLDEAGMEGRYIRVDVAERFAKALAGRGVPPITREEVMELAGIPRPPGGSTESAPTRPAAEPNEALTDVELVERAAAAVDTLIALAPPRVAARMQQHRPQITGDLFNLFKSWCAGDVAVGGISEDADRDIKRS